MNRTSTGIALFGVLALAGMLVAARTQEKKEPAAKEIVFVAADQAKYKEVATGASMAVIWGDPDKGAHRVFTKFVPGATFALHTHSSEIQIVVIKGAYLYKPEKGEEKRVGPGCYISIPAGDRHASGGDAKEGALFYQESSGKFDLTPIEVKK